MDTIPTASKSASLEYILVTIKLYIAFSLDWVGKPQVAMYRNVLNIIVKILFEMVTD